MLKPSTGRDIRVFIDNATCAVSKHDRDGCRFQPVQVSKSLIAESDIADDQDTPGFKVASKVLDLASKIGSKLVAVPTSESFSSPIHEVGSSPGSSLGNGSAEKLVDSLFEWLE